MNLNSILSIKICALFFVVCCSADCLLAQVTSENNAKLAEVLKRFPQADANKDGILTQEEARDFIKSRRANLANRGKQQPKIPPTHANVNYGPHSRNVLDLWLVESKEPTPLLICIHGGGFSGGDKSKYHSNTELIRRMHAAGISVASINYRLTEGGKYPFPIPMSDGGRALQFLRFQAEKYNLDKSRFGATGGSAGGCMLMWLGFHKDLADPDSKDPVLRESTRLQVLAPNGGQSTLHLPTLLKWFEVEQLTEHPAFRPLFAVPQDVDASRLDQKFVDLMIEASPITHLTNDDPPCYMTYPGNRKITETSSPGAWVHHPIMGFELQKAMHKLGLECHVQYRGGPKPMGYQDQLDFIISKLTK